MRRGLNPKLGGGGLHHVAIEAADFEASLRFYTDGLGFTERLRFPEETPDGTLTVAFLDAGDGTYVELFSPATSGPQQAGGSTPGGPALFHFALRVGDCDAATERARRAGATVEEEPTTTTLAGDPPVECRYSFVRGPSGESVELIAIAL